MGWLAVLIAGCYAPAIPEGAPCATTTECPAPLVCSGGACRASASTDDGATDTPLDDGAVADTPADGSVDAPIDAAPACAPLVTGAFSVQQITGVSAGGLDGSPWVSSDGLEMVFKSARAGVTPTETDLWITTRATTASTWGQPSRIAALSSDVADGSPRLSPDRLQVWFSSARNGNADIFTATRAAIGAAWSTPVPVTEVNSDRDDEGFFVLPSLLVAYMHSARGGAGNTHRIYRTSRASVSAPWSTPVQVGPTDADFQNPFVTPDECVMYVQAFRSTGNVDIEVSTRATPTGAWGAPAKIDGLASAVLEMDPFLFADQRTIYFARGSTISSLDLWRGSR